MNLRHALRRLGRQLKRGSAAPMPSAPLLLEPLEVRTVPSTITWTNRGSCASYAFCAPGTDNDNFASVFGPNANLARSVIDAARSSWTRVITNFHLSGGGNNLNVEISMAASGTGHGAGTTTWYRGDGYIDRASIGLGRGGDGLGSGYFVDPTPLEHGEYQGVPGNAFAGYAHVGSPAAGRFDLFSLVTHELGHAVGLLNLPRVRNVCNGNTGVPDRSSGGGTGRYFACVGTGGFHTLMTSFDTGGGDTGGAQHAAAANDPAFPITFGGRTYWGTDDLMNPWYFAGQRRLPSNNMAFVSRDAYNYTVTRPDFFGTFYAVLNQSTGHLVVRGRQNGMSNDTVTLRIDPDGSLIVTLNQSNPVPGMNVTWPLTSLWAPGSVRSIRVETGDGNDVIHVQSLSSGMPLTIDTGGGNDTVRLTGPSGNLGNIRSSVTFNGGAGQDAVFLFDDFFTGNATYTLTSSAVTAGVPGFQLNYNSSVEGLTLYSGIGASTANVLSTAAGVTTTLNMGDGNDTVRVGQPGLFNFGALVVNGDGNSDQLIVDDQTNNTAQTYTVTPSQVTRTGGGVAAITYNGIENLTLNTGSGAETVNIDGTAAATPVRVNAQGGADRFNVRSIASPVTINAGAGDDVITIANAANQLRNIRALLRVNGDGGRDQLIADDRGWTSSDEMYRVRPTSIEVPAIGGFGLDFTTVEEVRLRTGTRNDSVFVQGTGANVLTVIETGDGNDQVHIGSGGPPPAASTINAVSGDVVVHGQAGNDRLFYNDQGNGPDARRRYDLRPNRITRTPFPNAVGEVQFFTTESVDLHPSSRVDVFGTAAGVTTTITAGTHDDLIVVGNALNRLDDIQGALTIRGGGGRDMLRLNDTGSLAARVYTFAGNLVSRDGIAPIRHEAITTVETFAGNQDDVFDAQSTPAGTNLSIDGGAGFDYLFGPNDPAVWSVGGFSTDTGGLTSGVFGGPVTFVANENLIGGSDTDHFFFSGLASLSGYVDGGGSTNTLDYGDYSSGVYVDLSQYLAAGMAFVVNVQNVLGSAHDDLLRGDDGVNVLDGRAGRDIILGMGGNDHCQGGGGRDILIGGTGEDLLEGGADEDILIDGYTSYDYDDASLDSIWAEWGRTDLSYAERVSSLRPFLKLWDGVDGTVFNDGEADTLYGETSTGGVPELDWFFIDALDWTPDLVWPPEEVN